MIPTSMIPHSYVADDAGALLVRSGLVSSSALDEARARVAELGGTLGEQLVVARRGRRRRADRLLQVAPARPAGQPEHARAPAGEGRRGDPERHGDRAARDPGVARRREQPHGRDERSVGPPRRRRDRVLHRRVRRARGRDADADRVVPRALLRPRHGARPAPAPGRRRAGADRARRRGAASSGPMPRARPHREVDAARHRAVPPVTGAQMAIRPSAAAGRPRRPSARAADAARRDDGRRRRRRRPRAGAERAVPRVGRLVEQPRARSVSGEIRVASRARSRSSRTRSPDDESAAPVITIEADRRPSPTRALACRRRRPSASPRPTPSARRRAAAPRARRARSARARRARRRGRHREPGRSARSISRSRAS